MTEINVTGLKRLEEHLELSAEAADELLSRASIGSAGLSDVYRKWNGRGGGAQMNVRSFKRLTSER